jgi:hypothetical protein
MLIVNNQIDGPCHGIMIDTRRQIPISTPDGIKWYTTPVDLDSVIEAAKRVCDVSGEELETAREELRRAVANANL